jgi:hypothetical protein
MEAYGSFSLPCRVLGVKGAALLHLLGESKVEQVVMKEGVS